MLKCYWQRVLSYFRLKKLEFDTAAYVVLDLELTSLNSNHNEMVSIGWLHIFERKIDLRSARYFLNKEVKTLSQSPIYHGIDEQQLQAGDSLFHIMTELAQAMKGRVLVCHNATLDWLYIRRICLQLKVPIEPLAVIDTLKIEQRRLLRQGSMLAEDSLTLTNCRKRYQLPDSCSHHALSDALATAELLLAQVNAIGAGKCIKLADLV